MKSKTLTLSEFENYINSKSNIRICYSYENQEDYSQIPLSLVVYFNKVLIGHHTRQIYFEYSEKPTDNHIFKTRFRIVEVTKIKISSVGFGDKITIHEKIGNNLTKKYIFLLDYDREK